MVFRCRLMLDPGQICFFEVLKGSADVRFSAWSE
ncbi:MAG: hypothetical protein JWP79_352 [Polaromonas sp.]|nr:hypothetical protein [Polaromonas sp.]